MSTIPDKKRPNGLDRTEELLWAILDGQAMPGWRQRACRLLGSQAVLRAELCRRDLLDRRLRAWASPDPVPAERATLPAEAALARYPARSWLARILRPSSVLRLAQ